MLIAQTPELVPEDIVKALLPLHLAEIRLLLLIRQIGHGTLHEITIANGVPVLIEQIEKKVKLT